MFTWLKQRFLRLLGIALTLVGLFGDLEFAASVFGFELQWRAIIDRLDFPPWAPWAAVGLGLALIWLDVKRPWRREVYEIQPEALWRSRPVSHGDDAGPNWFANDAYLVVYNATRDGKTLRGVQARLYAGIDECVLPAETPGPVDVLHGQPSLFHVGRVIAPEVLGPVFMPPVDVSEQELMIAQREQRYGRNSFRFFMTGERRFSLAVIPGTTFDALIVVSAVDMASLQIKATFRASDDGLSLAFKRIP